MLETDVAWAAGIFEGEGSWSPSNFGLGVRASLNMTDKDIMERFYHIVGVGRLAERNPPSRPAHHRPTWEWRTAKLADVVTVYEMFKPWLGERRTARGAELITAARARSNTNCRICGYDLVEAGVRKDAIYCSSSCRSSARIKRKRIKP